MDPAERVVLHVDMDAFYAGVEVRDNPALRGVPLVVGADPRGGKGRGVVCTASYEARKFGIKSAMPISQAWRAAPHATFVRPDFKRYVAESRKVMAILARYADQLEVAGLDEAYLDVTERVRGADGTVDWDLARSLGRSLQAAVTRELRLSCSVGIAPNKSCAKVASDARKPHGVFRIRTDEVAAYLEPRPVRVLHGCGPKTAAALAEEGIHTCGDLVRAPADRLAARFGVHGAWLQRVAAGDDPRPVDGDRGERKTRGSETTFFQDERDPAAVRAVADGLLDELLGDMRRDGRAFATLTVKVRYAGFETLTRARTMERPMAADDPLAAPAARATVHALLAPLLGGKAVRLVGVRLSGFSEREGQTALHAFGIGWAGVANPLLHGAVPLSAAPRQRLPAGAFDPGGLRWTNLDGFAAG